MDITLEKRYLGCLLGLASGDAVGTSLEFKPRGSFTPIRDMLGGGPFNLQAGQWTDDTSMALCLAHSLLYHEGFNPEDQMNRYCNWWQHGYMSSTGECFDIGITVSSALNRYLQTKSPFQGSTDPQSAGNGSLMRLAPVILFYYPHQDLILKYAGESSRTTHGAQECLDACQFFALLIKLALDGQSKQEILHAHAYSASTENIRKIAQADYCHKDISEIKGSGYVVQSLEAALWCFAKTDTFDAAILEAANLGDDADTTAAICGQLAGAYYGVDNINPEWLNKLSMKDDIAQLATSFLSRKK